MKRFIGIKIILMIALSAYGQNKINLQTQVKGVLPIQNGGTGATTPGLAALPVGCSSPGAGQITCTLAFSTSNSNGGITGTGGDGSTLTPNVVNIGYIVPCSGINILCTVANRWNLSWGTSHLGAIPAVGTPGVSGHAVVFQANGIDLQDGGTIGVQAIPRLARWSYSPAAIQNANKLQTFGIDSLVLIGTGATSTGVNSASPNGPFDRFQTGAVSGNQAGFTSNANPGPWVQGRNPYTAMLLGDTTSDLTNQRLWFGFTDVNTSYANTEALLNDDTPGSSLHMAMFRYSSVALDINWQCVTGNASAQTTTNSNVVADTNFHTFEIQFNDSIPNVIFKIDGTSVCTNTTNLPSGGVAFDVLTLQTTQTAAAKRHDVVWVYTQSQ